MIKNITISALLVIILNMLPGNWYGGILTRIVISILIFLCLLILITELEHVIK